MVHELGPNVGAARGASRCCHNVCSGHIAQGRGLPNGDELAGVVSVGGAFYEWIGESVFADSRQLSKALVRGRPGSSWKAQSSDLLRGQIPAHRQHRQKLLIAILKPIAAERLTALRRLTLRYG